MSERMMYGDLLPGYFRHLDQDGHVYYAGQHRRWKEHVKVEGGVISQQAENSSLYPSEIVKVLEEIEAQVLKA